MVAAKGAKAEEAPVVARLRERIARVFAYVEDVMYVGLAALLALSALVLLGETGRPRGVNVLGSQLAWLAPLVVPQLEAEDMELDTPCSVSVLGHAFYHELFVSNDRSTRSAHLSRRRASRHVRRAVIR